jgi:hypothetical protein
MDAHTAIERPVPHSVKWLLTQADTARQVGDRARATRYIALAYDVLDGVSIEDMGESGLAGEHVVAGFRGL